MYDLPANRTQGVVQSAIAAVWRPEPLAMPCVVEDLPQFGFLERSAAALSWQVLRLEYALSPSGYLRAWAMLCLKTAIVLGIPATLVVPVVTIIMAGIATWTALLATAALNMLLALVYVVLIAAILATVVSVVGVRIGRIR